DIRIFSKHARGQRLPDIQKFVAEQAGLAQIDGLLDRSDELLVLPIGASARGDRNEDCLWRLILRPLKMKSDARLLTFAGDDLSPIIDNQAAPRFGGVEPLGVIEQ